jgi:hypothetical protein
LVDQSIHLILHLLLFLFLSLATITAAIPCALGLGGCFTNMVTVLENIGITWPSPAPKTCYAIVGA